MMENKGKLEIVTSEQDGVSHWFMLSSSHGRFLQRRYGYNYPYNYKYYVTIRRLEYWDELYYYSTQSARVFNFYRDGRRYILCC